MGAGRLLPPVSANSASAVLASPDRSASGKARLRAALAGQIARIEGRAPVLDAPVLGDGAANEPDAVPVGVIPFGVEAFDALLGGGLDPAALHEVRGAQMADAAAAAAFAALLGARLAGFGGAAFWICEARLQHEAGPLSAHGLAALGLDPAAFIAVTPRTLAETLWAAGEAAALPAGRDRASGQGQAGGFTLVEFAGNPAAVDLALTRRLALRAVTARRPVILLRQSGQAEASAAATRWHIAAAPSDTGNTQGNTRSAQNGWPQNKWLGPPAFAVRLEKCRSGRAGLLQHPLIVEWNRHERCFEHRPDNRLESRLSGRPATHAPAASRSGGGFADVANELVALRSAG